ncbi:MAG: two pore domain potassium channel family protein [Chloroflexota bacterium]|jgi:hypothetical protein
MSTRSDLALEHAVQGKVIYLLALIVLVQFAYPITAYGTLALIAYELLYASMIVVGILLGRDSRFHTLFLSITGAIYLSDSLLYALNPGAIWTVVTTYLALIPYLGMLLWILGRFLAAVQTITRDVLYAAVALYLLIGALFVPIYGLLDILLPGSFRDGTFPDAPVQWQQLIYFSYTTLTSSGYGDILPASWWARSLANLEMIAGVFFITIVMSRLVSLYSENKGENS